MRISDMGYSEIIFTDNDGKEIFRVDDNEDAISETDSKALYVPVKEFLQLYLKSLSGWITKVRAKEAIKNAFSEVIDSLISKEAGSRE